MKNIVFWAVMPCGCFKSRRFGGKYRPHFQDGNNERARNNFVASYSLRFS
jgi:hypothetical protein